MKTPRFDVVVVGELNPDLILSGNVLPEFGQVEKLVDQAELTIGSSSAIFACGAARLGLKVAFIGMVGKDLFGEFMCQSLENYGIDISGIRATDGTQTGISVILGDRHDRAILTYPGTIPLLEYGEIDLDIIQQARHLHVGSYFIQEKLKRSLPVLFDKAHSYGMSVSLDTNYDPTNLWDGGLFELLSKVDVFLPNEVECRGIARASTLEQAIDGLIKKVSYLGVKLGRDGAILAHNANKYTLKPIEVNVIDTVGAGDSFDAGFIYGFLNGWIPERILKLAIICGSLSTQKTGGTAAQPKLDEAMGHM
jgi:sugar/nucleoside kinase (ribokinase family)